MDNLALKRLKVKNMLHLFSEEELDKLISSKKLPEKKLKFKDLYGIWEVENIDIEELERELKEMRRELAEEMDRKGDMKYVLDTVTFIRFL